MEYKRCSSCIPGDLTGYYQLGQLSPVHVVQAMIIMQFDFALTNMPEPRLPMIIMDWKPTFAIDVDNFKFTPRVQRLNELEVSLMSQFYIFLNASAFVIKTGSTTQWQATDLAPKEMAASDMRNRRHPGQLSPVHVVQAMIIMASTRIKLNFLDQIAKFWELQGSSLRIPNVERRALDLYSLYNTVRQEGGMETISKERKWTRLALKMGYHHSKGIGTLLKQHYERILYPYDVFTSGVPLTDLNMESDLPTMTENKKDYVPHGIPSRQAINPPPERYTRRSKRHAKPELLEAKMPSHAQNQDKKPEIKEQEIHVVQAMIIMQGSHSRDTEELSAMIIMKEMVRQIEKILCHSCGKGDAEADMLLCDGCDDSFHTFCLIPPLPEVPRGDWRCPWCLAQEVSKPQEAFGFEQARKEYTLKEFGERADEFKSNYFKMPPASVPTSLVEKEFWRIVHAVDEDVKVEYGADLHTMEHGSGFPTLKAKTLIPQDMAMIIMDYVKSGWNLNNLPVLEKSILRHINADISGMKVPWVYVGMCFATFCWHNEDHWSYSINYLHWGEPKTWYGVPGHEADKFETAMRSEAPQLFDAQPDLLHHLVTILNPNILMEKGIPVSLQVRGCLSPRLTAPPTVQIFRTDQQAGEFVVTFPRAYHAGFNQGYNFAEAVNFATSNWLPLGRLCIKNYSNLHRFCVFSHDELVCKIAMDPSSLDYTLAEAVYQDMLTMAENEVRLQKAIADWGVADSSVEAFELVPDDERQCEHCKTTCFLSAVTCFCAESNGKLVCGEHMDRLCSCPPGKHCLRYRYTLDELPIMVARIKAKADAYAEWRDQVHRAIKPETEEVKLELSEFHNLVQQAEEHNFPLIEDFKALQVALEHSEKVVALAQQLLSRKVRTSTRGTGHDNHVHVVQAMIIMVGRSRRLLLLNRHCGETKAGTRLTIEDLEHFSSQLSGLKCHVKEAIQVQVVIVVGMPRCLILALLAIAGIEPNPGPWGNRPTFETSPEDLLDRVRSFQSDAKLFLDEPGVESKKVEKLLDVGMGLDIDLPEIPLLKQRVQQAKWMEKVRSSLEGGGVGLEVVRNLIDAGVSLPPHSAVEFGLAELQEILTQGERCDEKAKQCLVARPRLDLPFLEAVVTEASKIPISLNSVRVLSEVVQRAKAWVSKVESLLSNSTFPYHDVLRYLLSRARPLPVRLDPLPSIEANVEAARAWLERTSRTFLKKNSTYTLLEVLSPKSDIGQYPLLKGKKKKTKDPEKEKDGELGTADFELKLEDAKHPAMVVSAIRQAEKDELEAMHKLRTLNIRKRIEDKGDAKYCLCRKGFTTHMLQCELCKEWYHNNCVPFPKNSLARRHSPNSGGGGSKFLCPQCQRSRRPRLETILSLLVSLQKLPVRVAEGEALQCLTERAMSWQDRAKQALSSEELSGALAQLSLISQRMVEQAAREKTEKIISSELLKVAGNSDSLRLATYWPPQDQVPAVASEQEVPTAMIIMAMIIMGGELEEDLEEEEVSSSYSMEHAYSTASKMAAAVVSSSSKQSRKSPLVPRRQGMQSPLVTLSDTSAAQLEQLMVEGDLLEVALDEAQHIWRILSAARPDAGSDLAAFYETITEVEPHLPQKLSPKKRARKRKSEDIKNIPRKAMIIMGGHPTTAAKLLKKRKVKPPRSSSSSSTSSRSSVEPPARKLSTGPRKEEPRTTTSSATRGSGKKRPKGRRKQEETVKEEAAENEELCSAATCQKPTGNVNWVQCDGGCDLWFHYFCLDLRPDDIKESEDFICPKCKRP
ncbi:KDM5A [Cordylochernes scorpioides]|uniref:[histone H3]-trimethyl-L-lysine(4) demethylase n=1 Tax=Cordylochernes scorpioides TaxID=51811 RepID=A0ABY6K8Z0_9ARAC|nr:KDM5A [Cordylochernes scorpioides]